MTVISPVGQPALPFRGPLPNPTPLHHRDGMDTEQAAAQAAIPAAGTIRRAVLAHIVSCGERGSTDVETEAALGLSRPSGSNRRKELVDAGLVCDSGRRRLTGTGRFAAVWVATEAGRQAVQS